MNLPEVLPRITSILKSGWKIDLIIRKSRAFSVANREASL